MPPWMSIGLCLLFFFVTTFLGTWAIREGGSFAFLTPRYWKERAENSGARAPRGDRVR